MAKGGRYAKKKEKKAQGAGKIVLIVVAVLLVLVIAAVIAGVVYYNSMINLINRPEKVENSLSQEEIDEIMNFNPDAETIVETTVPETTVETLPEFTASGRTITNILVVGQSAREDEEYRLADTTILATINRETSTLTLTSFLRDMYIQLPNYKGHTCGMQRFNVCYHLGWKWGDTLGAMEMTNLCLKNNFGIEVDHNVEIGFDSFKQVIDLVGGVDVVLDADEAAYMNEDQWVTVQEGKNTINGHAALVYARMRHSSNGDSDIKRTARQRAVISAILDKVRGLSLAELNEIVKTILPTITTNMTNEEITTCIWEILPLLKDLKVETGTCPAEGTYWGEYVDIGGSSASVLQFDAFNNKKILQALCEEPVTETAK